MTEPVPARQDASASVGDAAPATAGGDAADGAPKIDATFRNGTITAFGITTSFSLGFLSQWASSPGVWRLYDTLPAMAIFIGAAFQIRALALLLPIEGLAKPTYDRATRLFLVGLILTGVGVCAAVSFDAVSALLRGN